MNTPRDAESSQNTEIERKYIAPDLETLNHLKHMLLTRFNAEDRGCRAQVDTYYDTATFMLRGSGISFRIRERDGKYVATIKTPTAAAVGGGSTERYERELIIPDSNLHHCREFFVRHLPELKDMFDHLAPALTVKNERTTLMVTLGEAMFEASLDVVTYRQGELWGSDYQVEIELRSDASFGEVLRDFGQAIVEHFPQLELTQQSKYERGLERLLVDTAIRVDSLFATYGKAETATHSMRVAEIAVELAHRFEVDTSLAIQAGLLHDIGTVIPTEEKLAFSREHGLPILPEEEVYPGILHQRHSVILARDVFGVTTPEVLGAIGCHTTLRAGATELDKVVFLADKLSWDDAEAPFRKGVNAALKTSLDAACRLYIDWLLGPEGGVRVVHPWLEAAHRELQQG